MEKFLGRVVLFMTHLGLAVLKAHLLVWVVAKFFGPWLGVPPLGWVEALGVVYGAGLLTMPSAVEMAHIAGENVRSKLVQFSAAVAVSIGLMMSALVLAGMVWLFG